MPVEAKRPGYQRTVVPLTSGVDQGTDQRVLPIERLARVENAWQPRSGAYEHRHGFTKLTKDTTAGGTLDSARVLVSTGDELCLAGNRKLHAYNATLDEWVDRGHIGPALGSVRFVFNSDHTYDQADSASKDGYTLHVVRRVSISDTTVTNPLRELLVHVTTTDDQLVAAPRLFSPIVSSNSTTLVPHSVRAAFCTGRLLAFYTQGTGSSPELKVAEWDTSAPSTSPPAAAADTITADLLWQAENIRTYDAIGLSDGLYAVAYIDQTNQEITVETRNASHVVQRTETLSTNAPYVRVAICEDVTNSRIHILAVASGETSSIEAWGLNSGNLATSYGPVTVSSLGIGETADNLGIAHGSVTNRVQCAWMILNSASLVGTRLKHRGFDPDGTDLSTIGVRYNLVPRSRPFQHNGHFYVACDTSIASSIFTAPLSTAHDVVSPFLECSGLYELDYEPDFAYTTFVGLWDVGTAPFAAQFVSRLGACNNAYKLSGEWRFSTLSQSYYLQNAIGSNRVSASECRLDFTTRPLATSAIRGTAAIGGSVVVWYDGTRTQELGHAAPPCPYDFLSKDGDGSLPTDTDYSYQAVWTSYDARGLLHRSAPSLLFTVALTSPQDTAELEVSAMPATMRLDRVHQSVVWYRDVDGDRLRISEALRVTENDSTGPSVVFEDQNQPTGPLLYIASGELAAVAPEGSRIPIVHGGRLCLGDPFRRERVAFSKPFAPGGAGDQQRAPEFNEALGFVLPTDETITGMASLDDKWIVFTEHEIYAISGQGPADDGSQSDHSGLTLVSSDAGCIEASSVVAYPDGILFQSKAGIYELTRGMQLRFIGGAVENELATYSVVSSAVLVPEQTQIRFTVGTAPPAQLASRILVYDYSLKQWYVWTPKNASGVRLKIVSACLHQGVYHLAESDGTVWYEDSTTWLDDGVTWCPLAIEAVWRNQGGWARVRRVMPICRRENKSDLTIGLSHDYETTEDVTRTWTAQQIEDRFPSPGSVFEPVMSVRRQRCESIRVRIEDSAPTGGPAGTANGKGYSISGIALEWLPRRGLPKVPRF